MNPPNILVVEDEAVLAMDIQRRLVQLGYAVAGAALSGEEALALLEAQRPDLVLMDIRLQGELDGIATAELIRQRFHQPVVFLTAYSEDETLQRAKTAEPFGYILKPFEDRELRTVIEMALYKHQTQEEILRLNRLYAALSGVNQTIVHTTDREALLGKVCRALVEEGAFALAWIGWLDPQTAAVTPIAECGDTHGYTRKIKVYADQRPEGQGPVGTAIREGKAYICNRLFEDPRTQPWREAARQEGFQSLAALPIRFEDKVCGALTLYATEVDFFQSKEVKLLEEVAMDISFALDNLEMEAQRRRAEAQVQILSQAVEQSSVSIIITDLAGNIEYVNPKFTELTGYSREEVLGKNPRLLKSGETPAAEYQRLWETITAGQTWRGEFHNKKKNGQLYCEHASISPIRDAAGRVTRFLAVKEDITEKKQLEASLLRAQRVESVGRLASGIAHDLNNILAPILMCSSALGEMLQDQNAIEMMRIIEASAKRGTNIVKQVLTFSRGIEGKMGPVQLRHLIKEMGQIIRETFPKSITLKTEVAADLWAVIGEVTHLHQVLMNLCVNARDAMPEGGALAILAENQTLDEQYAAMNPSARLGPHVRLTVADTGSGIPPENLDRIFDPFFTTKAEGKGTGLGLATVIGIVKSLGGFIQVQSTVGRGSRFEIWFPAAPATQPAPAPAEAAGSRRGQGELVLVVDDESSIRESLGKTLEQNGFRTLTAAEGTEAIALFCQHWQQVQVVLTDLMMPQMDGVALVRTLLKLEPQVRIIISSGGEPGQYGGKAEELRSLGITTFLVKPYSKDDLLNRLQELLHPVS